MPPEDGQSSGRRREPYCILGEQVPSTRDTEKCLSRTANRVTVVVYLESDGRKKEWESWNRE